MISSTKESAKAWSTGENLPLFLPPRLRTEPLQARIEKISNSRHYSNFGNMERELREAFGSLYSVEAERIVTFSSGTSALAGAIASVSQETIAVPDFGFTAIVSACKMAGKKVMSLPVDSTSGEIVSEHGVSQVVATAPIAIFGADPTPHLAGGAGVVDAAASILNNSSSFPKHSPPVLFSLHATKPIHSGEGGLGIFGSDSHAEEVRRWTSFGMNKRSREVSSYGLNAKLAEVSAAVALTCLDDFESIKDRWAGLMEHRDTVSRELGLPIFQTMESGMVPYWNIKTQSASQTRALMRHLETAGVESRNWWPTRLGSLDWTEDTSSPTRLNSEVLGLPFFLDMSKDDITGVAQLVSGFIEERS